MEIKLVHFYACVHLVRYKPRRACAHSFHANEALASQRGGTRPCDRALRRIGQLGQDAAELDRRVERLLEEVLLVRHVAQPNPWHGGMVVPQRLPAKS